MFDENHTIHHATRAKAEKLASLLAAEYPAISLEPVANEIGKVTGFLAHHRDEPSSDPTQIGEFSKVPELADLMDACEAMGLDPEAQSEEDAGPSGSIVDEAYRRMYKEQSTNGQTCGDWLAEWLTCQVGTGGGLFDKDAFDAILTKSGVDLSARWAQVVGGHGWQGRYRMNGRQTLEKTVSWSGELFDAQGHAVEIPTPFLDAIRGKHAKWIAKRQKKEEAEQAVANASIG